MQITQLSPSLKSPGLNILQHFITLPDSEHVLTAAHCAAGGFAFIMQLGAHNTKADSESGRIEITSYSAKVHPGWDEDNLHNDLAIITLPEPAPINGNTSFRLFHFSSYLFFSVAICLLMQKIWNLGPFGAL